MADVTVKQQLEKAVRHVLEKVGLEVFKKTSLFLSNKDKLNG